MEANDYIRRLKRELDGEYEACRPLLNEYKSFLEKQIEKTPDDIEAVCMLASVNMELRMDCDHSVTILEQFLRDFGESLSDTDKARLFTNLAYYHDDKGFGDLDLCRNYLEKAIASVKTPGVCDALGRLYGHSGNVEEALKFFRFAAELGDDFRYRYNYAATLMQNGFYENAKDIFETLLLQNENNPFVLYGLSAFYCSMRDKTNAVRYIEKTIEANTDNDINKSQIADLFYICGEYARHNAMYDSSAYGYYYEASWLGLYFYCLQALGETEELSRKFAEIISYKNTDIEEWEADDGLCGTEEYVQYLILKNKAEIADIESVYRKIVSEKFIPEIKITFDYLSGCYLADCIRHQNNV